MASYFDLPPQKAAPPASIDQMPQDQRKQLGRMNSLMSPAITQILEGLGDDHSGSSSEEESLSGAENESANQPPQKYIDTQKINENKQKHHVAQAPRPSSLSPSRSHLKSSTSKASGQSKSSSARANGDSSAKAKHKQPHMTRFHSLRSMLFQQKIEDQMKTVTKEDAQREQSAADKWRSQHEERQMHHPTTPEKDAQAKSGIGSRLKMTMRRMTTKDAGGMEKIREDGAPVKFKDRSSTASSDNEEKQRNLSKERNDSDDESIHNSDVEDLVRWVSRRDPASDGEARKNEVVEDLKEDSGHESLGQSDVEELVRYASRKSDTKDAKKVNDDHSGYSDASTESDTELQEASSDDEEDADDLVRWISHRDGSKAGPVRRNLQRLELDSDVGEHYDSDVPELGRWFKRHDGTSGESTATTPIKDASEEQTEDEEEHRGRPRSRESAGPPVKEKRHITDADVDELVRWVSRKDSKQQDVPIPESHDRVESLKRDEEEKKQAIGMSVDQGSLSHSDVQELVEHARKTSGETKAITSEPFDVETGDLNTLRSGDATPVQVSQQQLAGKRQEIEHGEKEEQLGMSMEDGSLSHSDV
ncbi:hypothetical protein DDE82_006891 [Stemphylium lycopersici]|nr:hypothetical protein TW65_03433 [Stemphylium lycopersici]RAR00901.1 hypothetical protein DDE82_006891 [Stemphylium lycopersici]